MSLRRIRGGGSEPEGESGRSGVGRPIGRLEAAWSGSSDGGKGVPKADGSARKAALYLPGLRPPRLLPHRLENFEISSEEKQEELERKGWGIEVYHRGLKQCGGVERAHVRKAVSILGHWLLALRAFLRLEAYRLRTGVSGDEAQAAILREAIRRYRVHPRYVLQPTA
jgi:hypothetical protein